MNIVVIRPEASSRWDLVLHWALSHLADIYVWDCVEYRGVYMCVQTYSHIHSPILHKASDINFCSQPDSLVSEGSKALAASHLPVSDKTWLIPASSQVSAQRSTTDSVSSPLVSVHSPATLLLLQMMTPFEREAVSLFRGGILQE